MNYPTPHINATPDDFGQTVLMPGDPLRSKYIAERGATLNNPHVTKAHLDTFAGSNRVVSGPNWASGIRQIAIEFVRANPGHPAAMARPGTPGPA